MASVLSSWARTVVDALVANGVDPARVLADAGFSSDSFRDPNARLPIQATARLWRKAAEAVGDPAFGLRVPRYARQTTFYALGYSVLASATLRDALDRAVRFCQVVADAGLLELEVAGDEAQLRIMSIPGYELGGDEFRDAVLAVLVRVSRRLTGGAFVLDHVQLRRAKGIDLRPYRDFFGCDVSLGEHDVLSFAAALLALPLEAANAELAKFNDAAVSDYLSRIASGTVVDRVRVAIADQLANDLTPESVARVLGMSLRSMQRTLREHDTSYEEVRSALRRDLACTYLRDGRYSMTEITFLLGYEGLSAFARAFKRWTGMTPSEYAAEHRRDKSEPAR
ncbi:MAG: AraC family transcriptional regulator [Myxococcaceae bacterium]|nr:AraC family transcriptional regulator [Myxococcaceae bacterium]